jgi:hypothetical protein
MRLFTSGLSRTMPPLKSVAMAPGATPPLDLAT